MVVIHIKRENKKNEFLFETSTASKTDQVLDDLVEVHNLRLKCLRLASTVRELAKHGPIRPEETRGLSESAKYCELDVNSYGMPTAPDEHGYRTGCPPPQETADVLIRTADEVDASLDVALVAQRKSITREVCKHNLEKLHGAVMIAYPAFHRLPVYDPARMELENREELDGRSELQDVLAPEETVMWWAGKEVIRGKHFHEFVGKNEKTKIVGKLAPRSAGQPARESRIDEATHKAMLSYYYKKQEEEKKLREDDDESYLNSKWANNKSLKNALVGNGPVMSWQPR